MLECVLSSDMHEANNRGKDACLSASGSGEPPVFTVASKPCYVLPHWRAGNETTSAKKRPAEDCDTKGIKDRRRDIRGIAIYRPEREHGASVVAVMESSEIFTALTKQLGSLLEIDPDKITRESTLLEDLDADSLDLLELIVSFRDQFGITVSDGEVKEFLAELARFLPGRTFEGTDDLSDEQLAEVARALTVGAIADFIEDRLQKMD